MVGTAISHLVRREEHPNDKKATAAHCSVACGLVKTNFFAVNEYILPLKIEGPPPEHQYTNSDNSIEKS
jgi:hypothetical protein